MSMIDKNIMYRSFTKKEINDFFDKAKPLLENTKVVNTKVYFKLHEMWHYFNNIPINGGSLPPLQFLKF